VTDYSRVQPELQYSHAKDGSSSSSRTTDIYPSQDGNPASRPHVQGPFAGADGYLPGTGGFSTGHSSDNSADLVQKESDFRLREGAAELCSLKKPSSNAYAR
jgi:hypothetical protein